MELWCSNFLERVSIYQPGIDKCQCFRFYFFMYLLVFWLNCVKLSWELNLRYMLFITSFYTQMCSFWLSFIFQMYFSFLYSHLNDSHIQASCVFSPLLVLGVHELQQEEHGGLEYWQRSAGLQWRSPQYSADDFTVLQQWYVQPQRTDLGLHYLLTL